MKTQVRRCVGRGAINSCMFLVGIFGIVLCCAPTPSVAGELIYYWVDKRGDLHATNKLADVPEPYFSLYETRAKNRKVEDRKGKAAASKRTSPVIVPRTTHAEIKRQLAKEDADRARWKRLMLKWRTVLDNATQELRRFERELVETNANPILRHTPGVKQKAAQIEKRRKSVLAKIEEAREMLLHKLPQQARKEGVPPKWLLQ